MLGLGPSASGRPPRPGKPTLTLGIPPDCPALDCEPASPLTPEGIPALDDEPADELEAELDDDAEELDELDDEEGIEGGCEEDRDDDEGIDALLLELLDALEGLLGEEGIDDDDELWLCD